MNDLMTPESLATLGGASFATITIANTSQHVFGFNPKWLALAVAEVIMLGVTVSATPAGEVGPYLIAIINGVIVYSSAVGTNTLTGTPTPTAMGSTDERPTRTFGSRWF